MLRARGGGCSGSKAKDGTDDEKRHDTWIQDLGDKPKKAYSAFVSHYKAEAAMEARYLQGELEAALPGRRVFLDSDDLHDLRLLKQAGAVAADCLELPSVDYLEPTPPRPPLNPPLLGDDAHAPAVCVHACATCRSGRLGRPGAAAVGARARAAVVPHRARHRPRGGYPHHVRLAHHRPGRLRLCTGRIATREPGERAGVPQPGRGGGSG